MVSLDHIHTLFLVRCQKPIPWILPALRYVYLNNSPSSLENLAFLPPSVCSIRIDLQYDTHQFVMPKWSELRSLSALPKMSSLRLTLFDVTTTPDETSCQIIAEVASTMADFSFCFQRSNGLIDDCRAFIEQLRYRILTVSGKNQPCYTVSSLGCELIVWF